MKLFINLSNDFIALFQPFFDFDERPDALTHRDRKLDRAIPFYLIDNLAAVSFRHRGNRQRQQ